MKKTTTLIAILNLTFLANVTAQNAKVKRIIESPTPTVSLTAVSIPSIPILTSDEQIVKVDNHIGNSIELTILNTSTNTQTTNTYQINTYSFLAVANNSTAFSAINIPFKLRFKTDSIPSVVETSIENLGLFIGRKRETERYFYSGRKTFHAISIGAFVSPTAITLNAGNTGGKVEDEITQLGVSTGIGLSYTYNKVSFMFIPVGFDFGTSSKTGNWVYNGKYWLGFGVGIDTGYFL